MQGLVIHIAGNVVQIGSQRRQRCSWCGAILMDDDLSRMAAPIEYDAEGNEVPWDGPPGWPPGELIAIDHAGVVAQEENTAISLTAGYVFEHEDGAPLPPEACGQLPHELTAGTITGGD